MEEVTEGPSMPNFAPSVQRVAPAACGAKNVKNRPLSKLNTGALRCAQTAMLPVIRAGSRT